MDSAATRRKAARIAGAVPGVQAVHDFLEPSSPPESVGRYLDDATLTARVKAVLIGDPLTHVSAIDVATARGVVQLAGWVDDPAETAEAARMARRPAPVERACQNCWLADSVPEVGVVSN